MFGFNSILVRLKVEWKPHQGSRKSQFQFHTGSIKRKTKMAAEKRNRICFNSILVRLKVEKMRQEKDENLVSIPYWFD